MESAAARNEELLAREREAAWARAAELRDGLIRWSWRRDDSNAEEVVTSAQCWTLRLPLTTERAVWGYLNLYRGLGGDALLLDINYLCDLFQRELACAAERVLSADEPRAADATTLAVSVSSGD